MNSIDQLKGTLSLTVSELTRYLRQLLEADEVLQDVWVQGEISNLGRPASGHVYFTLKDQSSSLRCVIWRNNAIRISSQLIEGSAIEAHGTITVYETAGQYQLITDSIRPKGEGSLFQEFLRLKKALDEEGLFDSNRKREIPKFPKRVGIITSPSGAALQDILNTLKRRNPMLEVTIVPSSVQGLEAPLELIRALKYMNRIIKPDVILLARGGGSMEDLWAFNDERFVREIITTSCPVITGIGHETDFTLSDFAADLRAPTPTAAAELATPYTVSDLKESLLALTRTLTEAIELSIKKQIDQVREILLRLKYCSPYRRIQVEWQSNDSLNRRLIDIQLHKILIEKAKIKGLGDQLLSLNPNNILKRGFAVVTRSTDGKLITKKEQAIIGDGLTVRVQNGDFPVLVSSQNME